MHCGCYADSLLCGIRSPYFLHWFFSQNPKPHYGCLRIFSVSFVFFSVPIYTYYAMLTFKPFAIPSAVNGCAVHLLALFTALKVLLFCLSLYFVLSSVVKEFFLDFSFFFPSFLSWYWHFEAFLLFYFDIVYSVTTLYLAPLCVLGLDALLVKGQVSEHDMKLTFANLFTVWTRIRMVWKLHTSQGSAWDHVWIWIFVFLLKIWIQNMSESFCCFWRFGSKTDKYRNGHSVCCGFKWSWAAQAHG